MKIVIHLNHGTNRSFLLEVNHGTSVRTVREILSGANHDAAITKLIKRSHVIRELFDFERQKAARSADFTVSNDFVVERLA